MHAVKMRLAAFGTLLLAANCALPSYDLQPLEDDTGGQGDGDQIQGDGDTPSGDGDGSSGDGDRPQGDGDRPQGDGDGGDGDVPGGDGDGDLPLGDGDGGDGDIPLGDGDGGDGDVGPSGKDCGSESTNLIDDMQSEPTSICEVEGRLGYWFAYPGNNAAMDFGMYPPDGYFTYDPLYYIDGYYDFPYWLSYISYTVFYPVGYLANIWIDPQSLGADSSARNYFPAGIIFAHQPAAEDQFPHLGVHMNSDENGDPLSYDASRYEGLRFYASSPDDFTYFATEFFVRFNTVYTSPTDNGGTCPDTATCYDAPGFRFTTTPGAWSRYEICFDDFESQDFGEADRTEHPMDPTQLLTLGFQAMDPTEPTVLVIDDVAFMTTCDSTTVPTPMD